MEATYTLTDKAWPEDGVIEVFALDGRRIVSISVQFLRIGRVLSWEYVTQAVAACVEEQQFQLCHRTDLCLAPIDLSSLPSASNVYCQVLTQAHQTTSKSTPRLRVGPRFHYKMRGPDEGDTGTMSHSSRSTARQSNFRFELAQRDGFCLVSNRKQAIGAHILPQSRPEYYKEVFGRDPGDLFHVSYGLFLERTLHYTFDRGEWGLYPDPSSPEDLVVHVFHGDSGILQWHGKIVPHSRFRIDQIGELPDRRLLRFHYQQCMIKHLRGFSFFPADPSNDDDEA